MDKNLVKYFLDKICKPIIHTYKFNLYGFEDGYEKVEAFNFGYLPFYSEKELKITVDILDDNSPLKANEMRKSTNYVTIHNTGMAHPSATAKGLNEYIHTTTRVASWHFSVDDNEAYQELKVDEVGWHAGDGSHKFGDRYFNKTYNSWCIGGGNENSVAIEMCEYKGCNFNKVMRNTAKLVSDLLIKYDLTPACVRQHNDFSGKNCPQVIREANRWEEMLELIDIEYLKKTLLKDYTFEFVSLNKDIMDDNGNVLNSSKDNRKINYKVIVKYGNESLSIDYKSIIEGMNYEED